MMMRRENTNRSDHLKFLAVTAKTRRCYEKSVAAFFVYARALRGRLPRNLVELDEELAEYINICFRKEITSPWAVGQLVGCGASFRRAAFILQLLSSSTGTGAGYISRNAPLRCRGWVPKLWRRQPFESIGWILQLWCCWGLPSFCVQWNLFHFISITFDSFLMREPWWSQSLILKLPEACNNPSLCMSRSWSMC